MNLAQVHAIGALTSVTRLMSGGLLQLYSGSQPASPESAITTSNTLLVSFTFSIPAFTQPFSIVNAEQQAAGFSPASVTPIATGLASFARATIQPATWTVATPYTVGQIIAANGNLYYCLLAGTSLSGGSGPNTSAGAIVDGTVKPVIWQYLAPFASTVVADFSVGTSGTDIILTNTSVSPTNNVTILEFLLAVPAS